MIATCSFDHKRTGEVDADGVEAYLGPNNIHAMAACIEELLQLNKSLDFLPASPTDDGGGKQASNSLYS